MLEDIPLDHIFNVDESAVLYRTTSSRSYVTINNDKRGVKRSKERITITPVVSASGEKLELQVIGKSKHPRALKGIDINSTFNVHYDHQAKAWQDGSSMLKLYHRFNRVALKRKSVLYMLLDNCSSHVWAAKLLDPDGSQETCFKFKNIVIIFFPPNATSDCQPLDQGIIRSIKARFRSLQLQTLLSEYELWQSGRDECDTSKFPINEHTHLRNGLLWLKKAWEGLSGQVIRRCFAKANCLPPASQAELNTCVDRGSEVQANKDPAVNELASLLSRVKIFEPLSKATGLDISGPDTAVDELLELDADVATGNSNIDEDEIIVEGLIACGVEIETESDESNDVDVNEVVSHGTAIDALQKLRSYLPMCTSDSAVTSFVVKLERDHNLNVLQILVQLQKHVSSQWKSEKNERLQQSTLEDYFRKKGSSTAAPSYSNLTAASFSAAASSSSAVSEPVQFELPTTWEGMNQLYHAYNIEGHGKGAPVTKQSMSKCLNHLLAWVAHVEPGTEGVRIAMMHIDRIEQKMSSISV